MLICLTGRYLTTILVMEFIRSIPKNLLYLQTMKIAITLLLTFLYLIAFPQGVNNFWLMGYRNGRGGINLDFIGNNLTISQDTLRIMSFEETNGEISDAGGNL